MKVNKTRFKNETYFFIITFVLVFGALETLGGISGTERPIITVISCSMYPDYNIGDVVFIRGVELDEIEEGDVIVFDRGEDAEGTPVIHRVIGVHDGYVETMGDNSDQQLPFEKEITEDRIYGRAGPGLPYLGYFKLFVVDLVGYGEPNMGPGRNTPLALNNQYSCTSS